MKRAISLGLFVLALGSCQSDDAPTQSTSDATDQVGVLARLQSKSALPAAERFRARLTIGGVANSWTDSPYVKGKAIQLGRVARGSAIDLDVRAYTARGTDTVWKWFARKSDSAKTDLSWTVLEVQVDTLPVGKSLSAQAGQSLAVPAGSWYTTDSTTPWSSLAPRVVDASGTIVPTAGSVLRIRLRVVVPGTTDTLPGDTTWFSIPPAAVAVDAPRFNPPSSRLAAGTTIRIDTVKFGDVIQYRTLGAAAWTSYSAPIPAGNFTLEARALRGVDASQIVTATYTLDVPVDSFVAAPKFAPASGSTLATSDSIRFDSIPSGDTVEIRRNQGTVWEVASALPATTDTVYARSRRGAFLSTVVRGVFTIRAGQPSMPYFTQSGTCPSDGCDPGIQVRIANDSGTLEYATDTTSDWKTWTSGDPLALSSTTTLFARTTRGGIRSATAQLTVAIVQPAPVVIDSIDRDPDTVRVRLSTTSGSIRYLLVGQSTPTQISGTGSIAVPVGDSIRAWSVRGTRSSGESSFKATALKPSRPGIVPTTTSGPLALEEVVRLVPATLGDSLQYRLGGSTAWIGYTGTLRSGTNGTFQVTARALRHGLASDDTTRTFQVDTARVAAPSLSPACDPSCDPGTVLTLKAGFGLVLEHGPIADSSRWSRTGDSLVAFTATHDTTVYARTASATRTSPVATLVVRIRQPDTVSVFEYARYPDSVRIRILASHGDTILYAPNADLAYTNTGKTDSVQVTVRVLDSLRIWTKRGTGFGAAKVYRALPGTPVAPTIAPSAGHIRDTTSISLGGIAGDTIAFRIGTGGLWTRYTAPFQLPAGTFVIHKRSVRYGRTAEDSATFVVHARPDTVTFLGCTANCSPGTNLAITPEAGSLAYWSSDTTKPSPWIAYAGSPLAFNVTTTVWAYADSAGYRSRTTRATVQVVQPGYPALASVRTKRTSLSATTDSAFVTIASAQDGDSLRIRVGSSAVKSSLVSGSASVVQVLLPNQTVTAWTTRGSTKSDSVSYTFKALPAPVEQTPSGTYNRGKSFAFVLAGTGAGSESTDAIVLSTSPGSWIRATAIAPTAIGNDTVYARTVRKGVDGLFSDSSAIRKVAYTIDTTMLIGLSTTPGTFTTSFQPSVLTYIDSVDATAASLEVTYTARTPADIQSVRFNGGVDPVVALTNAARQTIDVEVVNVYGTTTNYTVDVRKRASDSALSSLSTTPGTLFPNFSPGTTSYNDSVAFDATSVVVSAVPRTAGDVASIKYNGGTTKTIALNATGVTSIVVDITNTSGRHLTYTLLVYKKSFPYGSVTHGGKTYKTATIGTQTWMAENLQYGGAANDTGACPGADGTKIPGADAACAQYGRIYTWYEVVGGNTSGSSLSPSGIQGVCPTDWHVPSNAEWTTLRNFVESDPRVGVEAAGLALESKTVWNYTPGTDLFGFGAVPGWSRSASGTFNAPSIPNFWSSTRPGTGATSWNLYGNGIGTVEFDPGVGMEVRCVKN